MCISYSYSSDSCVFRWFSVRRYVGLTTSTHVSSSSNSCGRTRTTTLTLERAAIEVAVNHIAVYYYPQKYAQVYCTTTKHTISTSRDESQCGLKNRRGNSVVEDSFLLHGHKIACEPFSTRLTLFKDVQIKQQVKKQSPTARTYEQVIMPPRTAGNNAFILTYTWQRTQFCEILELN